jgi:3'-phosphoadenosine 5'-phosphosulfate sulfotransferase
MGRKFRCLDVFVLVILLVGFNGNFIGADSLPEVIEDSSEVEVVSDVEVLATGEVEEGFDYIDIDEIVDEVEDNVSDEENFSDVEVFENESFDFEGNFSEEENVSEVCFDYVDIDTLESEELQVKEDDDLVIPEKIVERQFKDGRLELEFEILEGDFVEIKKKEIKRGEFEKDVLISSEEHFEDEVRVYSDLPSPARIEDVVVVWESEDEVVEVLEYFDSDSDGLVERISWIVPHLSSQRYSIRIVVSGEENSVGNILLDVDAPRDGDVVLNPIDFNVSINYFNKSAVECSISIDGVGSLAVKDGESFPWTEPLSSGNHTWSVFCQDKDNPSIVNSSSGNFVVFDFSINPLNSFYFNNSDISGSVNSQGDFSLELRRNGVNQNIVNSGSSFLIESSKISVPGNYELLATTSYYNESLSVSKNFSVGGISVGFPPSVEVDENVNFVITGYNVDAAYDLYVGSVSHSGNFGSKTISSKFSQGNYSVQLRNIRVNSVNYPDMSFGTLRVVNSGDTSEPEISLIYPDWEEEVNSDDIIFEYKAKDNVGIANCSLKIYNSTEDFDGYTTEDLIYPLSSDDKVLAVEKDLVNEEKVELRLVDFDEGYYAYEVRCFDAAGNEEWDSNFFSVSLNGTKKILESEANYERKVEIENLIEKMNLFLEKEKSFGLEERRILEILGLSSNMASWKKRVVQMDQDLKFNLKFMETTKREARIKEIYAELDDIEEKIVLDVRSVDSYEFSKGSVDLDIEDVIGNYFSASGIDMKKSSLKSLVNYNEGLQKDLDVLVEAWKLELDYLSGTREIILVSKNLDVSGDGNLLVLEIIPEEYEKDLYMVSDVKSVGENIYSVDVSDLKNGNLVYYFENGFALKEVEKMESILFGEGGSGGGISITGMFLGVGDSISFGSFFWLPLILFIGYFGFLMVGRFRLEAWKKEPGVEELVRLINDTSVLIREGRVDVARNNYNRMGEIYKALPVKCRDFFYGEIKRIRLAIDKKDVLNLIKEYEAAKDSFRKEDAVMLHAKINTIYRKLPKKFQEKVYRRLVKKEV